MSKRRPFIFLGVGLLNTLLDFLFYNFLIYTFFSSTGDIWIVGVLSGTFALICAYLTHQFITWKDHAASRATIVKFFLFTGFGLWVIRPALLTLFISFNGLYQLVHDFINPLVPLSFDFIQSTGAFGFMVVIVMTYNYLTYDRFVFNKKAKKPSTDQ